MSLKLNSSGGGSVTLQEPTTASNVTLNLPAADATVLTDSAGVLNIGSGQVYKDASGNVGIGTSSPSNKFVVSNGGANGFEVNPSTGNIFTFNRSTLAYTDTTLTANNIIFQSGGATERARITSGGDFLVGTTDAGITTGVGFKFNPSATVPTSGVVVNSAVGNSSHIHLFNTNATNNGYRFYVVSNGGIYNFSGNNSNLSDVRTKTNIQLAGGYLAKVCAIPVKLFNYKDEAEGEQRTLGVIAQDVEAVAPELVNNDGFGETPEGEEPLKSIYTTDMMYALMKCIQELKAELDATKAKVAALEAQ
jgi:hypothetical protein